jgi:hypothetical protein
MSIFSSLMGSAYMCKDGSVSAALVWKENRSDYYHS